MLERFALMGLVVAALSCGGGNGVKRACMGGVSDNPLVVDAAVLKLDVYSATAHCLAGTLAAGAEAPIMSHTYAPGESIALDVPPGPHALVLTTYSDPAGAKRLGQGCTEADVQPGAHVCFDLTIVPAQLNCPAGLGDCDGDPTNGCETPTTTTSNCGGCGNVCDATHSVGAGCVDGSCQYSGCTTGFADCNTTAPNTDGCEADLASNVDHCGGCGRACASNGVAVRSCSGGVCDSTCISGFGNCSRPAAGASMPYVADDGCESNLNTCTAQACCTTAMPTPANMCAPPAAHVDGPVSIGLGQGYADCRPLGTPGDPTTYTVAMAMEARAAAPAGMDVAAGICSGANCINRVINGYCVVWCYQNGTSPAIKIAGHVYRQLNPYNPSTGNGCPCPIEADPTWN